jgi:DNA repair protein RadC
MKPREKFLQRGVDSLTEKELISIIISSGSGRRSYKEIASSVSNLLFDGEKENRPLKDSLAGAKGLLAVDGIGKVKAIQIASAIELGRRYYKFHNATGRSRVLTTKDSLMQFDSIRNKKKEYLMGLFLNARFEKLGLEVIAVGSQNVLSVQPKDIFISALQLNATYILLGHNHPSGCSKPSREDVELTRSVQELARKLGFILLEHLVLAKDGWHSILGGME